MTVGPRTDNDTFYNPALTAMGNRTYSTTLTQDANRNAYGLMFGGANLADDTQTYTYFEIRQEGECHLATRESATVTPVVAWTKIAVTFCSHPA